jgi:hypothetical protein
MPQICGLFGIVDLALDEEFDRCDCTGICQSGRVIKLIVFVRARSKTE